MFRVPVLFPFMYEYFFVFRYKAQGKVTMKPFEIVQISDPARYRDQIVKFWDSYLPGTPAERFEWIGKLNPAGPSTWFLAFEKGSDKVAGTVSVMPRRIYYHDIEYMAGIVGDFMVDGKYRVFGPNIKLLKKVLDSLDKLALSFIYTVPNDASAKVAERVGLKVITPLKCFARPINMRYYLEKILPTPAAVVAAPAADFFLRLSSRETWSSFKGIVEETKEINSAFDVLWQRVRKRNHGIIGERSSEYLQWRYMHNPLSDFRIIVAREAGSDDLSGYAVFCLREDDKLDVYDMIAMNDKCRDALVSSLVKIASVEKYQAIYVLGPEGSRRFSELKPFRFMDTKITLFLGYFGEPEVSLENWDFVNGDRNI